MAKLWVIRLACPECGPQYLPIPKVTGFTGPLGRCKATAPSFLSLTTNENLLTCYPRQTAQIAEVCAPDRVLEPLMDISMKISINNIIIFLTNL